jgi:magnesium transporter
MARFIKDRAASRGKVPGSLILIGKQKMEKPEIRLMDIETDQLVEKELKSIDGASQYKDSAPVSWINIWGIHDLGMMEKLGNIFQLDSIFLEDVLNTDQRPRYETGESYNAIILKMIKYDQTSKSISSEQLTLILGKRYLVTLQEQVGDVFDPVRERIRNTKRRIRFTDADYLAYALLDTIVEGYIFVTEALGREIESLDEKIFAGPDPKLIAQIHKLKTELSYLRKSIRPVREIMAQVIKAENEMFQEKYHNYIRDLNDLVIQTTDAIELYSAMISDHLNIYSTTISNRTNEVMKVLTIFASIFIPLTFLAGIYGMNFQNIPELSFKYGYLVFWILVVVIGIALVVYFRRKKWL